MAEETTKLISKLFAQIPFGLPTESLPSKEALGFRVPLYGFDQWNKLYTPRQLMALGTFLKWTRAWKEQIARHYAAEEWNEAVLSYLAISLDRLADRSATLCTWDQGYTKVNHVF